MADNSLSQEFIKQRQERVYILYRSGMTQTAISKVLSISVPMVHSDIQAYVKMLYDSMKVTANLQKVIQVDRLDYLAERISTQVKKGDLKAVQVALNIAVNKSKLLGLDSEVSNKTEDFPVDVNFAEVSVDGEGEQSQNMNSVRLSEMDDETLKKLYFQNLQESSI